MPEIKDKYQEPLEGDPVALSVPMQDRDPDPEGVGKKVEIESNESVSKKQEILELEKQLAEKKQELSQVPMQDRDPDPEGVGKKPATPIAPASKLSSKISAQIKRLKALDRESQIKELCNLSFSEDLDFAVNVAKGLDSAYVLDEFHDALVDELYDKLIEKGELKKT